MQYIPAENFKNFSVELVIQNKKFNAIIQNGVAYFFKLFP